MAEISTLPEFLDYVTQRAGDNPRAVTHAKRVISQYHWSRTVVLIEYERPDDDPVSDWCRDNCTGQWERVGPAILFFACERDALLFALFHE